ncbi:MAG TPA: hypothetical protein VFU36_04675 [Jatrophihabitans sp.]|nr:hypothetical protein [Jatrophihabitans sp.]
MTDDGSTGRGPATSVLPADLGTRYATRFYLTRLAVLGGLGLVAVLVPVITVLFQDGTHALGASIVGLILLTLVVFRSTLRDRGALSPASAAFAEPPRLALRLLAAVARLLRHHD